MSALFIKRIVFGWMLSISASSLAQESWPRFLGHDASARSESDVPTTWSDSENLLWKAKLPGTGSSSPIVTADCVFVTCYVEADPPRRTLHCFDKRTGAELWSREFLIDYPEDDYQGYITEHGYASNTPATDGESVFVFFGKGGVHRVDMDGDLIWSVDVGKQSSNRRWGSASSVVLHGEHVIVNAAEESRAIHCLRKTDGSEVWKQQADMLELAYGTPRIASRGDEESELLIGVPEEIWSLNPETGKLRWYAASPMTGNVSPSIIVHGDRAYGFGGYRGAGSIAVRLGGSGDVTDSHVMWTNRTSSYVATPLRVGDRFYWIDDRGIAYCTDIHQGETVYRSRVDGLAGQRPVYASPIFAGGHIYVVSRQSGTLVISPADELEVKSQNRFESDDSDFNATPAISDGRIYLRSNRSLYCVGSPQA